MYFMGDHENVILPNTVKIVGDYAFKGSKVKDVFFPTSVREIDICAFYQSALETVTFDVSSQLKKTGVNAFGRTKVDESLIPVIAEK